MVAPASLRAERLASAASARASGVAALGELVRGIDAAHSAALVSVLVRMVFLLLAEAQGMLPREGQSSLTGLHAELRAGALDDRGDAWARVLALAGGSLDPVAGPVSDDAVLRALDALVVEGGQPLPYSDLPVEHLGAVYEGLVGLDDRRRAGLHYTSPAMTKVVVAQTLAPLLRDRASPDEILALKVCDPAMGSGAFLVEACRQIAGYLALAWGSTMDDTDTIARALSLVARRCLYGVDKNPLAVDIARLSLWLVSRAGDQPLSFVDRALRHGDALVGLAPGERGGPALDRLLSDGEGRHVPFHWEAELPEVFAEGRGGFDAIVGNPPWVSYAGRAAQPLAPDLRAYYLASSPAFHGYRNLQGIFVHRAATLLRPGGRLGLVLPTSMSDLGGYGPSRRAHDTLCAPDPDLPDFGDRAFEGVFQPSMALYSTRRATPVPLDAALPWPLHRRDVDEETAAVLDRLACLPRLPPHLFGERGFQTTGEDVKRLHKLPGPEGDLAVGVRAGGDIAPFVRRPPRRYCDPRAFGGRFRAAEEWSSVKLLIRQTARYPMAALSDGAAFRNSILAGFSDDAHGAGFLLAYLNATPIRWYHYMRHRDARQGMPQVKIAHLRAIPAPAPGSPAVAHLERLGRELGERNAGASAAEQETIDALVADALGLDDSARARIAVWAASVRG